MESPPMPAINIVLFEPEIPPNTGNIIRLAANANCALHLIKPFGFKLEEKSLRRAGLDYREYMELKIYDNFQHFLELNPNARILAGTTKASVAHSSVRFALNDYIIFGPESRGLPNYILEDNNNIAGNIRIPMHPNSRSLNLSNSVAIVLYEALRQLEYPELN